MVFIMFICLCVYLCTNQEHLRILDIHAAKITKNETPWYILFHYFTTRQPIKNLNVQVYQDICPDQHV